MKIVEEKEKAVLQPKVKEIKLPKISKMTIGNKECFATTSLAVAEFTGKRHDNVLRDIRNLISKYGEGEIAQPKSGQSNDFSDLCSPLVYGEVEIALFKFEESNDFSDLCSPLVYQESTYKDSSGIARTMFILDEEFTTMLIMGFGTERALLWKRAYIREFKRMRDVEIELSNKLEVAKEAIITLATMMTREKGDFMAELHKLQCSFLSSMVSADSYAAVNFAYTKAINIASLLFILQTPKVYCADPIFRLNRLHCKNQHHICFLCHRLRECARIPYVSMRVYQKRKLLS